MEQTPNSSRKRIIIIVIVAVIALAGTLLLGAYLGGKGTINVSSLPSINTGSSSSVGYTDVLRHVGQKVTLKGYVIVPNTDKVCFGGWSTCKLWLDNDPWQKGMGLHEVSIPVGSGRNSITIDGVLRSSTGGKIKLVENDAFSWYYVKVTGTVLHCKGSGCLIEVSTIKSE